jgi:hypothetical protein
MVVGELKWILQISPTENQISAGSDILRIYAKSQNCMYDSDISTL